MSTLWLWGLGAALTSYLAVRALISYAQRRLLDMPNERSSHSRPTPRGGGLGIVVAVLLGCGLLFALDEHARNPAFAIYVLCAAGIAVLGFVDDLYSLRASVRMLLQSAAALGLLLATGGFSELHVPGWGTVSLGLLGFPLAFIWIVGLTNAYNFMDGIDGIAGSQAVVAGLAWSVAGALTGQPLLSALGALLAGASLGFLGHNWPPARIFMGDVGSTFLGFSLAAMPLLTRPPSSRAALFGLLVVAPFVADASLTFTRRLLRGDPVWQAHREHLYQRLVAGGFSHRRVTLLYAALAALCACVGFAYLRS